MDFRVQYSAMADGTIGEIKQVVTESAAVEKVVKTDITGSWHDFWHFDVATLEGGYHLTLGTIIIAFLCFIFGIAISKWLSKKITRRFFHRFKIHPNTIHIWTSITFYVSSLLVTILALKIAHVPLTIFTFLGGAIALGVGFGSKNMVNNFISGMIFMFEAPAKVGDFVEVEGYFGRVVDVGLRATHIEIGTNKRAIIPNSSFLEKPIVSWGSAGTPVYLSIQVSVDYNIDLRRVEKIMEDALASLPQIVQELPTRVMLKSFADSGIVLELWFATRLSAAGDRDIIPSLVRAKIEEAFAKGGVNIPYPQFVLHRRDQASTTNP